jgi:hypothetical protein
MQAMRERRQLHIQYKKDDFKIAIDPYIYGLSKLGDWIIYGWYSGPSHECWYAFDRDQIKSMGIGRKQFEIRDDAPLRVDFMDQYHAAITRLDSPE